ncbi:hypothetical protein CISIN_1g038062mg, partial [Citrus sinensis]
IRAAVPDDLSLGFNAGPASAPTPSAGPTSWPPSAAGQHSSSRGPINYGLSPEMGMFVVAPASSFNHHHHHLHHHLHNHESSINVNSSDPMAAQNAAAATALGVGVIPLLAADQDLLNNFNSRNNNKVSQIQFWQQNQNSHHQYFKKPAAASSSSTFLEHHNNFIPSGAVTVAAASGGGNNNSNNIAGCSSATTCQDCGNQAKKDCSHRRCRTCCKSRGFECSTHVKSTWVPASRRRERQLMAAAAATVGPGAAGSSGSTSGIKKPRLISSQTTSHTSTSNTTPPRSFDTTSSHQDASFKESLPGQIRAPAVFKCVRVTAVEDNGEDEYAYQAVVKIGGHVFKGFLYDQGVDDHHHQTREGFPNMAELHLGGGASSSGPGGSGNGGKNAACSSSPNILDPSDVYAASAGGFLGGSTYGNPIN